MEYIRGNIVQRVLRHNKSSVQGSVIHLPSSSSSSSSSDSEIDAEDIPDDIRITDSGVSSDTSNTNNSSEVRVEIAEEKLDSSSQDDASSINSRDEIEREKVNRMKRMFEEKIQTNKVSHLSQNRASSRPNSIIVPEVFKVDKSSIIPTRSKVRVFTPAPGLRKATSVPTLSQPTEEISSPISSSRRSSSDSSGSDSTSTLEIEKYDNYDSKFESEETNDNFDNKFESNDAKDDEFIHVRKTDDDFVKLRKRSEVGSLKNKFELLIQDNNARKSSFINWKSSNQNLQSKPISKTFTQSTPNLSSETGDNDPYRQTQEEGTRRYSNLNSSSEDDVENEFQKVYSHIEETEENLVLDKTVLPPPQFRDPQPEHIASKTQNNSAKITIPQHFMQQQHSENANNKHSSRSSGSPALTRKSYSVLELRSMFSGEQEHDANKAKVNNSSLKTKVMTESYFRDQKWPGMTAFLIFLRI